MHGRGCSNRSREHSTGAGCRCSSGPDPNGWVVRWPSCAWRARSRSMLALPIDPSIALSLHLCVQISNIPKNPSPSYVGTVWCVARASAVISTLLPPIRSKHMYMKLYIVPPSLASSPLFCFFFAFSIPITILYNNNNDHLRMDATCTTVDDHVLYIHNCIDLHVPCLRLCAGPPRARERQRARQAAEVGPAWTGWNPAETPGFELHRCWTVLVSSSKVATLGGCLVGKFFGEKLLQ